MKYLLRGGESAERLTLLLKATRIRSEAKIAAAHYYFVDGLPSSRARARSGLKQQKFSDLVKRLNEVAEIFEAVKVIDLQK